MLEPGSPAPAFQLPDQEGQVVSLQDLRGRWVVLYFYPRDDTPGCTVEACEFTAARRQFDGLDAVVLGCSADSSASHQKFIAKHELAVRLLTDADHAVMAAYGAWGKKKLYGKEIVGVLRSTVLIAPDGKLAHRWANVKTAGHAEQVRAKLAELQGVDGGKGASSPAGKAKKAAPKTATKAKARPKAKAKKS